MSSVCFTFVVRHKYTVLIYIKAPAAIIHITALIILCTITIHITTSTGSGNTLSTGIQVTITAIVCSLLCFTLGVLVGALFNRCVTVRCLCKSKSVPTSPAPVVYEEVSPDSYTRRKNDIELSENVAYGPVANIGV